MTNEKVENIREYMIKIEQLLEIGAHFLLNNLGEVLVKENKGDRDFALKTDIELEGIYKQHLFDAYPDIPILGEELSPRIVSNCFKGKFWAIDPIDGTVNYSRSIPEYGTSIALIDDGKPIAVGVCFPSLGETYIAGINEGAYLNGEKISISNNYRLRSSILAFGDFSVKENYQEENSIRFRFITNFANNVLRVRMPGSAALQLAWLASGRVDISLTLSNNAWDVQGGVLLVREAGGCVYDFDGSEHSISSKYTIASNKYIKAAIIDLVSQARRG